MQPRPRRSLAHELSSGFRLIVAAATAMVVAVLGMLTLLLARTLPAQHASDAVLAQLQPVVEDYFNTRSDVRTYLVTGATAYRQSYHSERDRLLASLDRLVSISGNPLRAQADSLRVAVDAWLTTDADEQATPAGRARLVDSSGQLSAATNRLLVLDGRRESARFFAARDRVLTAAQGREDDAEDQARWALLAGGLIIAVIGAGTAIVATVRSRRLTRSLNGPVSSMLNSARAVGRGEFRVEAIESDVAEIADLSDGLTDMATSLRLQQKALSGRADQAQRLAERLRRVLGFARDISSSLTLPTVLESITKAACLLAGAERARIWLIDDDGDQLRVAFDTHPQTGDREPLSRRELQDHAVAQAVASSRITQAAPTGELSADCDRSCALPLVASGRTIGAVEIDLSPHRPAVTAEVLETLEVVAGQGATAIDAARLYHRAEQLSLSDSLTGLGNRRLLDSDLELEVERSGRYGRPMSLLMVDVDHFKAINDAHGHAHGDAVLQGLSQVITDLLRSVDTAYRYGGEELAVLARETDVAGAVRLGERLRETIEARFAAGTTPATVSIGIASAPGHAGSAAQLLALADRALYDAKRGGRNRVVSAVGSSAAAAAAEDPVPAQPAPSR